MHRAKPLLNRSDWAVLILTVVLSFSLYFVFKHFFGESAGVASVYYNDQLVATLDLSIDDKILLKQEKYPDLLADLEVEVKNGKVRISKEESPRHICSKLGWTDSPLTPLVCLPNKVSVRVESGSFDDDGLDSVVH